MPARFVNIVVGAWLFISAFVWQHTGAEFTNTWICGVLAVVFAVIALSTPMARWLNTLLAIWLVIGTLAFRWVEPGTVWNNLICAAVIFIASLAPNAELSGPVLGQRRTTV